MLDLAIIILTFNEEKHIERCIRSVAGGVQKIYVVDSFSSDRTVEIARAMAVEVIQRKFINHANQFQWALDNLDIDTQWVMRLDADEYPEPFLVKEITEVLPQLPVDISGIYIKRKVVFQGQWIQYGGFYPHTLLRIWKTGYGHIEQRWMDEHIVLPSNLRTLTLNGHLVDDNLKGITFWIDKHNRYATREMADIIIHKYFPDKTDSSLRNMNTDPQARWKRIIKEDVYYKIFPGLRAFLYFFYRYFLRLGFMDGKKGFIYHFLQGFWYRLLVDLKVTEVEQRTNGDLQKMRGILFAEHGIEI